jgi:hypothetical protein
MNQFPSPCSTFGMPGQGAWVAFRHYIFLKCVIKSGNTLLHPYSNGKEQSNLFRTQQLTVLMNQEMGIQ